MAMFAHFLVFALLGQNADVGRPAEPEKIERIGPGVTSPKVLYKVDPAYSPEARNAGIQGTVVLEIVVSARGRATNISVLSPLGFGLDELAIAAVEQWRFQPGMRDGKPVNILATIEVNAL